MLALATFAGCGTRKHDDGPPITTRASSLLPDETTPIGQKWRALINAGINLGEATAVVQSVPGGAAQYQLFASFVIVYTNDFGAVYMPMVVFTKWLSLQSTPDASGSPVYGLFGVPMRDYVAISGRTETAFSGGMIVVDSAGVARAIFGGIYLKYVTIMSLLGEPTSEEAAPFFDATARYQTFTGGEIYWSPEAGGAWAITAGPILNKWRENQPELGVPFSDSVALFDDGGMAVGLSARFQLGAIYYNAATGVTSTLDAPLASHYEHHGGPTGWLGFPLASSNTTPAGDKRFNDFEHGVLVWSNPGSNVNARVFVFGDLQFFLQRVEANGTDCVAGVCGAQDLFYKVTVISSVHGTVVDDFRVPTHGSFNRSQDDFNDTMGPKMTANSALEIHGRVQVWDEDDDLGDDIDDRVGTPSKTYNIDNLWGSQDSTVHETGDAKATFSIQSTHEFDENDFRGQKYWSFRNFPTPDLGYDKYASTFLDVDDHESAPANPFNALYYELFYRGIAFGNCMGMGIESIYAAKGRSAIGMPIYDATGTLDGSELVRSAFPGLYDEINVKQGYQLGLESILWRIDRFLTGNTHNPGGVFNDSRRFFDAHDLPMLTITSDEFGAHAHTLVPYRWDNERQSCTRLDASECVRIFVADPNFPATAANPAADDPFRTRADDRFVEIEVNDDNPENIEYSYIGSSFDVGEVTYRGGTLLGARMFFEPAHKYMSMPVTPFYQPWVMATAAFLLIVGDTGKTLQVTDSGGRTLFEPGLTGIPTRWDQFRRDVNQRIPDLAPLMLSDRQSGGAQGWVGNGSGNSHTYAIIPAPGVVAGTPIRAMFNSGALSSTFSIPATPGKVNRVGAHDINGPTKAISLALAADEIAKPVTWTIAGVEKQRWLEFSSLQMSPGQNIRMRTENATRKVRITNNGPLTTANVTFKAGPGASPVNRGVLSIPTGDSTIEPDSVTCFSDSVCGAGQYCVNGACIVAPTPNSFAPAAWYVASPNDVRRVGNGVVEWFDRSGHNRHLQGPASVASWQPTYSDAGWNGNQPAVTFDGSALLRLDHWSDVPTGDDRAFTVLAVMRSGAASAQPAGVASWWNENGQGNVWCQLRTAGPRTLLDLSRMDPLLMGQVHTDGHDLGALPHVVAWRFGGEVSKLTVDGVTTTSPAQPSLSAISTDNTFLLGVTSALPTGMFTGDIAELVVVPSSLSDVDVAGFRAYALQKWGGMSASAPPDPCRSAAGQPLPPTTVCDDGNAATVADRCQSGACVGQIAGAGSPAGLSPLVWYSAADLDTSTSGSPVLQWFDRSGNGRHLTQIFPPGQPTFQATGWSGDQPAIRFDGGKAFRREEWAGTPAGNDSSFTVLAVLRSAVQQNASVASWWYPGGDGAACRLTSSGTGTVVDLLRRDATLMTQDFAATGDIGTTTGHVIAWRFSPETAKLTVDGTTTTVGPLPSLGSISISTFLVGVRDIYGSEFFRGDLAELAIVPGSVSDAAIANFRSYAQQKWHGLP
jgi:hypothetical protein